MKKIDFYSIIKVSESTHELIKESGEEIAALNGYIFYISKDRDCLKGGKGYTATDPATGCKLKHATTKKKLLEEMQDINFLDKIKHAQTTEFYKNRVKEFKKLLKALQSPKNAPERKDHEEPKQAPEAERKDNQDMKNTAKAQHNEAKENAAPKAAERKEDNNTMTNTNAATEKQINLIKKLQEEKKTILIEDFNGLTKKTASAIIGKLIYKVKATQEEEKQTKEEETPAAPKAAEVVATVEVVDPSQDLKSIQLVSNDLEKAKIIALHYDNNCFLNWYINKADRMNEHITKKLKDYKVFKTTDNLYLYLDFEKKSISSDLWYNDETEAPANSFENFKDYNLRKLSFKYLEDEDAHLGIIKVINQYNNNAVYYRVVQTIYKYDLYNNESYIRDLTNEEISDLKKLYSQYKNDYIKRLTTYWKKYQNKIYWCGYWANR